MREILSAPKPGPYKDSFMFRESFILPINISCHFITSAFNRFSDFLSSGDITKRAEILCFPSCGLLGRTNPPAMIARGQAFSRDLEPEWCLISECFEIFEMLQYLHKCYQLTTPSPKLYKMQNFLIPLSFRC